MARRRVVVIEDDAAIRRGLADALGYGGYDVVEAGTAEAGLKAGVAAGVDLLLLDLGLPGADGLTLLAELRIARPTLPVIIVTARGDEDDRVAGLQLGADDYVAKPFGVRELLARVQAVLRRSAERPLDRAEVAVPGGVADLGKREIRFGDGQRVELSEREADLLGYLARNPTRIVSRAELLERIWRLPANQVRTRTIDMHMVRLREKLRDHADEPRVIVTIRGRGYQFAGAP
jgi:DNA-binding response OmpR family regulator